AKPGPQRLGGRRGSGRLAEDLALLRRIRFRARWRSAIGELGTPASHLLRARRRSLGRNPARPDVVDGTGEQVRGHDGERRGSENGERASPDGGERLGYDAGFGGHVVPFVSRGGANRRRVEGPPTEIALPFRLLLELLLALDSE